MEDLLAPQIKDSCRLALPDGLKELMSDISREVLRTQPRNLYQFIANYLSALLITRDNLSVAAHICTDICQCTCKPDLQTELENLGLPEEDARIAGDIIVNYFDTGSVQESNLFMKLMKDTAIDEDMLPAVQTAIRNAFLRHQARHTTIYESSDDEHDDLMCAAKHTLNLYRKSAPTDETYELMSLKIQKSYRAYGVKRECKSKDSSHKVQHKLPDKAVTPENPSSSTPKSYDIAFPRTTYSEENTSGGSWPEDPEIAMSSNMVQKRITTISSTSLAGSFLKLPAHKPYSAHECEVLSNLEEMPEKEHAYIDYTAENPHLSLVSEEKVFIKRDSGKKISFSDSIPDDTQLALELEDDSEAKASSADQNESSLEVDTDLFYGSDVIIDSNNYDGDTEMERSNLDFNEICDRDIDI